MSGRAHPQWPDLPFAAWSGTCETLVLWTQIVGKVRIACTPLINHWWNATLVVTSRGLIAPAMRYRGRTFDVIFDFDEHRLRVDHVGTYVVPFLCRWSGGAWHSVDTSSPIEATVVGWRVR